MLTFITAKRAVLSSLTCAGLMATVLRIVNRWSGLRFHVPAPYGGRACSNSYTNAGLPAAEKRADARPSQPTPGSEEPSAMFSYQVQIATVSKRSPNGRMVGVPPT